MKTLFDPRMGYTAHEVGIKVLDNIQSAIAKRLPYKIKYWAYIHFAVEHLTDTDVVPNVTMTEIIQRSTP